MQNKNENKNIMMIDSDTHYDNSIEPIKEIKLKKMSTLFFWIKEYNMYLELSSTTNSARNTNKKLKTTFWQCETQLGWYYEHIQI